MLTVSHSGQFQKGVSILFNKNTSFIEIGKARQESKTKVTRFKTSVTLYLLNSFYNILSIFECIYIAIECQQVNAPLSPELH